MLIKSDITCLALVGVEEELGVLRGVFLWVVLNL